MPAALPQRTQISNAAASPAAPRPAASFRPTKMICSRSWTPPSPSRCEPGVIYARPAAAPEAQTASGFLALPPPAATVPALVHTPCLPSIPLQTYPVVTVTPDGGVVVAAGKTLVKYARTGPTTFKRQFPYTNRPGAPWSYPQTGVGLPLPLFPPYNRCGAGRGSVEAAGSRPALFCSISRPCRWSASPRHPPGWPRLTPAYPEPIPSPPLPPPCSMFFLAAGGSAQDRANENTPASAMAHVIEVQLYSALLQRCEHGLGQGTWLPASVGFQARAAAPAVVCAASEHAPTHPAAAAAAPPPPPAAADRRPGRRVEGFHHALWPRDG